MNSHNSPGNPMVDRTAETGTSESVGTARGATLILQLNLNNYE